MRPLTGSPDCGYSGVTGSEIGGVIFGSDTSGGLGVGVGSDGGGADWTGAGSDEDLSEESGGDSPPPPPQALRTAIEQTKSER